MGVVLESQGRQIGGKNSSSSLQAVAPAVPLHQHALFALPITKCLFIFRVSLFIFKSNSCVVLPGVVLNAFQEVLAAHLTWFVLLLHDTFLLYSLFIFTEKSKLLKTLHLGLICGIPASKVSSCASRIVYSGVY